MKKSFLLASFATISVLSFGQTKLDIQLSTLKSGNMAKTRSVNNNKQSARVVTIIGVLADDAVAPVNKLENMGIKVTFNAYGVVTMMVPANMIVELEGLKEFVSFEANTASTLANYNSQVADHAIDLQDEQKALAAGLPQTYNGEGIIVGIVDSGIDFNHVSFRDPETHKTRFKWVMRPKGTVDPDGMYDESGNPVSGMDAFNFYTGDVAIDTLTTDHRGNSHGTHTLCTAAGSYAGDYVNRSGNVNYTNLRGVAYKADLLATGTKLATPDVIMTSAKEMDDYATSIGKPLVLTISQGTTFDWLDGKLAINKFFDEFTDHGNKPGRIVCFSSMNDAHLPYTIHKELNAANDYTLKTLIEKSVYQDNIHIYNSNDADLDISLMVYDRDGKNFIKSYTMDQLKSLDMLVYQKSSAHDNRINAVLNLNGYFSEEGEIIEKWTKIVITIKSKDRVVCKPRLFARKDKSSLKGEFLSSDKFENITVGDGSSSSNCWSNTSSVLTVGAWTANNKYTTYYGEFNDNYPIYEDTKNLLNDIGYFSSYTIEDDNGVSHPDFCAPGVDVISGGNIYDESLMPEIFPENFIGIAKEEYGRQDGRQSIIIRKTGTSMATPNAAGIIALWMQANPNLTLNQVREVIKATADNDKYTAASPIRFGLGKINALAGLKYILEKYPCAIHEVENGEPKGLEEPMIKKVMENGKIVIYKNGVKYNVLGQRM